MNPTANPMFAKFDQILGKTTPTMASPGGQPMTSRANEIRNLAKTTQDQNNEVPIGHQGIQDAPIVKDIFNDVGSSMKKHAENIVNDVKENSAVLKDPNVGEGEKILKNAATGGHIAGNIAGTVGDMFGSVMSRLLPEDVKKVSSDAMSAAGQTINKIPGATDLLNKINDFLDSNPDVGKSTSDVTNTVSLLGGEKGTPAVKEAVDTGVNAVSNATKPLIDSVTGAVDELGNKISDTAGAVKEKISPGETVDQTTGKVLQGKTADIESGKKGLSNLDTSKVKSYKDLTDVSNNKIKDLASKQDEILAKDTTPRKVQQLALDQGKVNGKSVIHNYVIDAVNQLEELYSKTNDPVNLQKIKDLKVKLDPTKGSGLTLTEVNNLARDYGSEFGSKAFSKTGDPLTSINAQNFESTRAGVKDTVRNLLPDDASRALDKQMTDVYTVRDLSKNMSEKVNTLTQRLQKPNIFQKMGGYIGKGMRITGVGDLASKLLGIDKVPGAATLNAVELEAKLAKNLKRINDALAKDDTGFTNDMQQIIKDNSNETTNQ